MKYLAPSLHWVWVFPYWILDIKRAPDTSSLIYFVILFYNCQTEIWIFSINKSLFHHFNKFKLSFFVIGIWINIRTGFLFFFLPRFFSFSFFVFIFLLFFFFIVFFDNLLYENFRSSNKLWFIPGTLSWSIFLISVSGSLSCIQHLISTSENFIVSGRPILSRPTIASYNPGSRSFAKYHK